MFLFNKQEKLLGKVMLSWKRNETKTNTKKHPKSSEAKLSINCSTSASRNSSRLEKNK